jgi:multiple sugar transport system ATP-binding protein
MNEGRIEQLGEPLELYDRPVNLFVAQFIGSPAMNILDGVLRKSSSCVEILGQRWPVGALSGGIEGQAVKYGVRPEHIAVGGQGPVAAEVVVVEPMGAETELVVKVADASLVVTAHGRSDAKPGDAIKLAPHAASVHLFDAASGLRL